MEGLTMGQRNGLANMASQRPKTCQSGNFDNASLPIWQHKLHQFARAAALTR